MKSYTSIEQANEVLEYYENYILRCPYVIYIAVVEYKKGYTIDIGINYKYKDCVKPREIDEFEVYFGLFKNDEIPKYFPVPSEYLHKLRNIIKLNSYKIEDFFKIRDYHNQTNKSSLLLFQERINKSHDLKSDVSKISYKITYGSNNIDRQFLAEKSPIRRSYLIKNKFSKQATLGSTFKLLSFPKDYFGITNQHLFDYENAKLGDPIYNDNHKLLGHLFWTSDDKYREVAIIKLCENIPESHFKSTSNLQIQEPSIGMKVTHNGFATFPDEISNIYNSKIISTNATIRHIDSNTPNGWKIYKNQILIKHNTDYGDSGSIVITEDKNKQRKVVALNFGVTIERVSFNEKEEVKHIKSFSIANNILKIFNNEFNQKQEIYVDKISGFTQTTLINIFKLSNNIL
ncbi:hypothetical protein ACFO3O_04655 [Dokdonia ponticola]|uniref:Serine protease n=1 Tax=Dokdonia ponticola TaxID=2041041 RepID=A0ABV9HUI4_9FLAO